jgi:hypothetical protein
LRGELNRRVSDLDKGNYLGQTVLMLLVSKGLFDAVVELLKAGSAVNKIDLCRENAVFYLLNNENDYKRTFYVLRNYKIDLNQRNLCGVY